MAALFSPLLIYLEQGSVFLYNARLVSPVMPSNRHSYTVLAAACACVLAVCAFLFWQNRQKKNKLDAAVRGTFHAAARTGRHSGAAEGPA